MLRSLPTRLSRAVVGVLSVWCLGCTSLDIIIDRLVHGGATMAGCVRAEDAPVEPGRDGVPTVQQSEADPAFEGCGCSQCIAVQAPATALARAPHPTPNAVEQQLGGALRVDREPLVPPPITSANA